MILASNTDIKPSQHKPQITKSYYSCYYDHATIPRATAILLHYRRSTAVCCKPQTLWKRVPNSDIPGVKTFFLSPVTVESGIVLMLLSPLSSSVH